VKIKKMTSDGRRSLAKAATWRVTASADTFIISYIVTGEAGLAGAIAAVEVFTKVFIYYLHERIWNKVTWGKTLKKSKKV
jgi:uncharacterized membrane protein